MADNGGYITTYDHDNDADNNAKEVPCDNECKDHKVTSREFCRSKNTARTVSDVNNICHVCKQLKLAE